MKDCAEKLEELAEKIRIHDQNHGFTDDEYKKLNLFGSTIDWLIDRWGDSEKEKIQAEVNRLEVFLENVEKSKKKA